MALRFKQWVDLLGFVKTDNHAEIAKLDPNNRYAPQLTKLIAAHAAGEDITTHSFAKENGQHEQSSETPPNIVIRMITIVDHTGLDTSFIPVVNQPLESAGQLIVDADEFTYAEENTQKWFDKAKQAFNMDGKLSNDEFGVLLLAEFEKLQRMRAAKDQADKLKFRPNAELKQLLNNAKTQRDQKATSPAKAAVTTTTTVTTHTVATVVEPVKTVITTVVPEKAKAPTPTAQEIYVRACDDFIVNRDASKAQELTTAWAAAAINALKTKEIIDRNETANIVYTAFEALVIMVKRRKARDHFKFEPSDAIADLLLEGKDLAFKQRKADYLTAFKNLNTTSNTETLLAFKKAEDQLKLVIMVPEYNVGIEQFNAFETTQNAEYVQKGNNLSSKWFLDLMAGIRALRFPASVVTVEVATPGTMPSVELVKDVVIPVTSTNKNSTGTNKEEKKDEVKKDDEQQDKDKNGAASNNVKPELTVAHPATAAVQAFWATYSNRFNFGKKAPQNKRTIKARKLETAMGEINQLITDKKDTVSREELFSAVIQKLYPIVAENTGRNWRSQTTGETQLWALLTPIMSPKEKMLLHVELTAARLNKLNGDNKKQNKTTAKIGTVNALRSVLTLSEETGVAELQAQVLKTYQQRRSGNRFFACFPTETTSEKSFKTVMNMRNKK